MFSLMLIFFSFTGDNLEDDITPTSVIATEGLVTLSCQYNTTANNAYIYWYKQEANDFPKHMLRRYSFGSVDNAAGFNASLNAKTRSVPLTIQSGINSTLDHLPYSSSSLECPQTPL
uniref:Immunoglobulin V-set domain-containing protein n=1 Tax=Hucho hucho TaxID=62062 RepID=A0A4W5LVJ3_9TELE